MTDMNYISDPYPPLISNEELVIIEYFVRGENQAIASENLKLEYTVTSIRLSEHNGKLVAIGKQTNEWQRKVLLANDSDYRYGIVDCLTEQGFIAKQKSSHPDFTEYHQYKVPDGYKLNYTEAIQLWRGWWNNKRYQLNVTNIPIDIQIFSRGNWYPVQDLQPKQGNFAIQTARGESKILPEDYVVWIDEIVVATVTQADEHISNQLLPSPTVEGSVDLNDSELSTEVDLESYLSTFNTEDTADIDRIEGIYNIGELLSGINVDDILPPPPPSKPIGTVPATVSASSIGDSTPSYKTPSTARSLTLTAQQQQSLKLRAIQTLAKYLQAGDLVTHTEVLKNGQGQEINRKVTKIQRGCPSWAIDQVRKLE